MLWWDPEVDEAWKEVTVKEEGGKRGYEEGKRVEQTFVLGIC